MKRKPAVAGSFYSGSPEGLRRQVAELMPAPMPPRAQALGMIVPHAGYMYSGKVAALCYASVDVPDTYLLLGPNHTGLGADVAMMPDGRWDIPGGSLAIDEALGALIAAESPLVSPDEAAHRYEHSIEVQLPFIAATAPGAMILPIAVMTATLDGLMELGRSIARAVRRHARSVLIVASSDMSHFISDAEARKRDRLAIDRALALDPEGLYSTVLTNDITMCGFMPSVAMLSAALDLGARGAELLRYTTSAEASGDYSKVVGYAGIVVR